MFLLKKYFNDLYKNKFFKNNLVNIKDSITENKVDIILLDEGLLENTNNFFTEINFIKKKIFIILISSGNLHILDTSIFKYLEIKIINKPFSFLSLKSQIDKFNNNKSNFQDLNDVVSSAKNGLRETGELNYKLRSRILKRINKRRSIATI